MSAADARQVPAGKVLEADICVVGAGAAGISLALELARQSRDVLLLESGSATPDAALQGLYDLSSTGYPLRENYMSRARQFGGSCSLWAGRSMLLDPLDFEPRDWVPGSGWPIGYAEVAALYGEAAEVLELPRDSLVLPQRLPALLSPDEKSLFNDSAFRPTISLWARRPQRFGRSFLQQLTGAERIRLLMNGSVTSLRLNEGGDAIEGLDVASLDGNRFSIRARQYVLACGGLENARLLLASRDRAPGGVGNDHDQVGRCFMDHPRAVYGRVTVGSGVMLKGLRGLALRDGSMQVGIGLSADTQRRARLLNHYATFEEESSGYAQARYQAMVQTAKVLLRRGHAGSRWDFRAMGIRQLPEMIYLLSPKEILPHWMYRALVAARAALPRKRGPRRYIVVYFCEQPPEQSSRATLSGDVDALGMPRLNLHWHIPQSVCDSILQMQGLLASRLRETGMGELEPGSVDISFTDASHHMGTTRMSHDPSQGVVDGNLRVHGVRNLYMAGSSVFPCAGFANPTLTIVALSLRLARHLSLRAAR